MSICFVISPPQKKGTLRGLKAPFYFTKYLIGLVGMQWVLFENNSPKSNNNPTPNKYTYTSTLVCGYIMSHHALKCHQKNIGQEQLH